ncbi:MAG TPA: hypothetical protein PLV45_01920, partial [bacterium]|nr:hypothetical protein [bacterium]
MTWYKHPGWRTAGIAILALAAAQTVQVILFVAISAALQSSGSQASGWLNAAVMLPAVVSALAGGAFLGR